MKNDTRPLISPEQLARTDTDPYTTGDLAGDFDVFPEDLTVSLVVIGPDGNPTGERFRFIPANWDFGNGTLDVFVTR